ncbi:hypothetical protein HMN09_01215100 [Mycena chlorophos]|uniref:Uncharacterized protein n=1 Tax=Mycena chlorophos TaxID=658473 RepID=A0A8H6VY00_MYCCL|nr:hypothetical protein HMN09_01215100 [Mycena chlorophos]
MKIEWASHFRSDGSRRKPPPSVMHGWLAKMRGTLLGNEELRSKVGAKLAKLCQHQHAAQGMREMRDAKSYKKIQSQRRKSKPPQRRDTGSSALFGTLNPKPHPTQRPVGKGTPMRSPAGHRAVGSPPPRRHSHNVHSSASGSRPSPRRQASAPISPTSQRRHTPVRRHSGR